MTGNRLFHLLIAHADVAPGDGWAGVLQKPLDKHDVMSVVVVNARCIPLAEAVCADVLIAQMLTHQLEVVLDLAYRDGEQKGAVRNPVRVCIGSQEAVDLIWDSELAALARLLLHHVQAVSAAVLHDVGHMQAQNVSHAHPKIRLGCEDRRHSGIRAAIPKASQKGLDDVAVLDVG